MKTLLSRTFGCVVEARSAAVAGRSDACLAGRFQKFSEPHVMQHCCARRRAHSALVVVALIALAFCSRAAFAQEDFDETDALDFGGGTETSAMLTIDADGTSLLKTVTVEPRTTVEQQIWALARYEKMAEAGEGDATTAVLTATNEAKPFTDDELVKKISEQMDERAQNSGEKIRVELKTNAVIIVSTRSFSSPEEMVRESYSFWRAGQLSVANMRLEMDTNNLLRLTLTPQPRMERYLKTLRSQWKLSGMKGQVKLVFPGKVVSSDFPATQTNTTWLTMDAKDDASLDAVAKLNTVPVVITAEPAGYKLAQPLESKNLRRARGQAGGGDDLPVTDAGPGFVAEAQSVTTSTLRVFPGGESYFENNPADTGTVVRVKLFGPKGRTLKSISETRVIAAVDNKGRSVASDENESTQFGGDADQDGPVQFDLRLQLPQPDAQAIEKISAEAVAVTAGDWKELTLTNLAENATNALDLSAVLPDAKIFVTKFAMKRGQMNMQLRLEGPPTVNRLEVRAKVAGNNQFNSYSSERQTGKKSGVTTRTIVLQGYGIADEAATPEAVRLTVRYPEDVRRERVRFELKGLDLL
jgi:hypothetical protein